MATKFVTKNPAQQKKEIWALTQLNKPAVNVILHGQEDEREAIKMALNRITEEISAEPITVYSGAFISKSPLTYPSSRPNTLN